MVVLDGVSGDPASVVDLAAELAPFPPARASYYPGVRRVIADADAPAIAYVERTLNAAAPYIAGAFDCDRFDLIEASFSLVTTAPGALAPPQRGAHFDSTDPDHLAVMHYLSATAGTAFYRQRSTGIERVTAANVQSFIAHGQRESRAAAGYLNASDAAFEQTARVEGELDRLVIYQGALLHSGVIPPGEPLSDDPRLGRLTANVFVRLRR